jgi:hypothetical protein
MLAVVVYNARLIYTPRDPSSQLFSFRHTPLCTAFVRTAPCFVPLFSTNIILQRNNQLRLPPAPATTSSGYQPEGTITPSDISLRQRQRQRHLANVAAHTHFWVNLTRNSSDVSSAAIPHAQQIRQAPGRPKVHRGLSRPHTRLQGGPGQRRRPNRAMPPAQGPPGDQNHHLGERFARW